RDLRYNLVLAPAVDHGEAAGPARLHAEIDRGQAIARRGLRLLLEPAIRLHVGFDRLHRIQADDVKTGVADPVVGAIGDAEIHHSVELEYGAGVAYGTPGLVAVPALVQANVHFFARAWPEVARLGEPLFGPGPPELRQRPYPRRIAFCRAVLCTHEIGAAAEVGGQKDVMCVESPCGRGPRRPDLREAVGIAIVIDRAGLDEAVIFGAVLIQTEFNQQIVQLELDSNNKIEEPCERRHCYDLEKALPRLLEGDIEGIVQLLRGDDRVSYLVYIGQGAQAVRRLDPIRQFMCDAVARRAASIGAGAGRKRTRAISGVAFQGGDAAVDGISLKVGASLPALLLGLCGLFA